LQAFLDSSGIVLYLVDSSSTRGGGNLNQSNNHTFVPVIKQLHSRSYEGYAMTARWNLTFLNILGIQTWEINGYCRLIGY
jgi:hypothetical protein